MVDRIATFWQTRQITTGNMQIQSEYAKGQLQLSTGLKSVDYQGISSEADRILNTESEYKALSTQTSNAQTALDRTESMFDAFGSMLTLGQNFTSDIRTAISGNMTTSQLQSLAQDALRNMASSLNMTVGGRYVFGGSATKSAPVDLSGYGGQVIPSAPDTSYYQGNNYIQNVEVADGYTVNYGVTADNPAIEKVMRAFDLINTTPGDSATQQQALQLLEGGLDDLADLKASVSQSSQTLQNKINDNQTQMNLMQNTLSSLKDVDVAEVSVKLQQLEAQLQASYAVTTKLLNLSLADYLQ